MSMGFTHLRTFHAVAEHRGFTAAAAALGITQPTVTTQVRELEDRYGVELFLRLGRRIELTDVGTALLGITRMIMSLRDEADELLAGHGKFQAGHLRIAAVGPFHATEIIASLKQRHPAIQLSVLLGNSDQTLGKLTDLQADVAVLAHAVDDARVYTIRYRVHDVVAFVNGSHPWFRRKGVRLEELAAQPLVLREQGSTTRLAFERAMAERGLTIHPVLEIGSREGVWKAVEKGLGISVVADFEFVAHPNLRTLRIIDHPVRTEYRIACLKERVRSPKIKAFFDIAAGMSGASQIPES
jgi:aminoethylphosphonate catabolism LysR family transcriptional regulator